MSEQQPHLREAGLEVLSSGLNLAELDLHGGDAFWDEVQRFTRESHLEELADRCLAGRSAPRLWAVMEAPAAGAAAVATGLGLATVLADRGQAVVLLDGDEQEPRLTRWIGRIEQEGWIDMVRFGASLHASSVPLPSDNRRGSVVGVGSFAPTGITGDEVADLLGRLRHQADDVVMVLPAKLRSQPWMAASHIRLLCWDLLSRGGADTGTIVKELERMGGRPAFLVGFGVEEFSAIQQHLSEASGGAEDAARSEGEARSETDARSEADAEVETGAEAPVVPPVAPADTPDLVPAAEPAPGGGPAPETPPRRTSGIFIFAAVAAVACLALVGWFLADQRRGSEDPSTVPPVVVVERPLEVAVIEDEAGTEDPGVEDPGVEAVAPDVAAAKPDVTEVASGALLPDEPAGSDGPNGSDEPAAEPTAAPDVAAAFDPAPFRLPVGEAGWALWVYSLPDEDAAAVELRELERRGLLAVAREVEVEGRGRWHRVYTGSFATRAEAIAAAAGLKAELRHDWAVPSRF